MSDVADNIRRVICSVAAEALRATGAPSITVLDEDSAAGSLVFGWLTAALGGRCVRRSASLASNMHDEPGTLLAHPVSKTVLLLGGAPPRADLFPLGDLYASQSAQLGAAADLPGDVAALARAAGGVAALDAALARLVDSREPEDAALTGLPPDAAAGLLRLYERGRWHRRHAPVVPKLGARTYGVDLFD